MFFYTRASQIWLTLLYKYRYNLFLLDIVTSLFFNRPNRKIKKLWQMFGTKTNVSRCLRLWHWNEHRNWNSFPLFCCGAIHWWHYNIYIYIKQVMTCLQPTRQWWSADAWSGMKQAFQTDGMNSNSILNVNKIFHLKSFRIVWMILFLVSVPASHNRRMELLNSKIHRT